MSVFDLTNTVTGLSGDQENVSVASGVWHAFLVCLEMEISLRLAESLRLGLLLTDAAEQPQHAASAHRIQSSEAIYACGCLKLHGDWAAPSVIPAAAFQGQARACCNLGVIYFKQQQYHEAVGHFEKFFEKARGLHNQQTLDIARANLGAARAAVKFESYSQASLSAAVYDQSHYRAAAIPCTSTGMRSAGHCLPNTLTDVSSPTAIPSNSSYAAGCGQGSAHTASLEGHQDAI